MRHKQILTRDTSLLLIIDYQEKLLAAFKEPDQFLNPCIKLIRFAHILKLPILWTEQYPKGLGRTVDKVKNELSGLSPVEKTAFSCFGEPDFVRSLSAFPQDQLIVCGIETHICVEQSVLDAMEAGYQAHVVVDACGARKKRDHKAGLRKMENAGAVISSAETVIYEVLARSDAPEFRDVLQLVK